jgi:hypothetical protein
VICSFDIDKKFMTERNRPNLLDEHLVAPSQLSRVKLRIQRLRLRHLDRGGGRRVFRWCRILNENHLSRRPRLNTSSQLSICPVMSQLQRVTYSIFHTLLPHRLPLRVVVPIYSIAASTAIMSILLIYSTSMPFLLLNPSQHPLPSPQTNPWSQ